MPNRFLTGIKRSYHFASKFQIASLAEARTCQSAAEQTQHFIKGFEGSQLDCALSLEDTVFPASSPTDRVFALFDSGLKSLMVIGIECKDVGPRTDGRGNIFWGMEISDVQWRHMQFVIISTADEPDWVAVLPRHYISRVPEDERRHYRVPGFRAYWILHPLPAFAPEYNPFVLPLKRLGEALELIRKYARGEIPVCFNPHTLVKFVGMPKPKLSPVEILQPQFPSWLKSLVPIRFLQRAFRQYSEEFDVELCNVFPMFGDFKIKSRTDATELHVEINSGHCSVTYDEDEYSMSSMRHTQKYLLAGSPRFIFSWMAQWDFLLTFTSNDSLDDAFFVIKDAIPADWWNNYADERVDWPGEMLHVLEESRISLASPEEAVQQIEAILHETER
ncbi:MAG: hypothetical protein Q9180_001874, partial [Flavoplaca navasiana]